MADKRPSYALKSTSRYAEEYEDDGGMEVEEEGKPFIDRLLSRPWVAFLVLLLYVGYGTLQIVLDWIYVHEILNVERALVFGPPDSSIIVLIIIISAIGTASFIGELVNLVRKVVYKVEMVDEDTAQVCSLFFEEIPNTTLNALMASCREVPLSVIQLVRASWSIFGAALRCIRLLYAWWGNLRRNRRRGMIPCLIRCLVFGSCLYVAAASTMVWVFTYVQPPGLDGSISMRMPESVLSSSYDKARYFYKSGVFFSHPAFQHCRESSEGDNVTSPDETFASWIQLESLFDLDKSKQGAVAQFQCNRQDDPTSCILRFQADDANVSCYNISLDDNCLVERLQSNLSLCRMVTPDELLNATSSSLPLLQLQLFRSDKTRALLYGDVKFKGEIAGIDNENETSSILTTRCDLVLADEWGFLYDVEQNLQGRIHYLRVDKSINDTNIEHFLLDEVGLAFFTLDVNAFNVTETWKTGYRQCGMTGALGPNNLPDSSSGMGVHLCGDG